MLKRGYLASTSCYVSLAHTLMLLINTLMCLIWFFLSLLSVRRVALFNLYWKDQFVMEVLSD